MNAKLPTMGEFIRRDIVHGEYLGALTELARPCPCDGCALRERCAAEKLACKKFVVFVHGGMRSNLSRNPTRGHYAQAMAEEPPAWLRESVASRNARAARAVASWKEELVGVVVAGRTVVDITADEHGVCYAHLHCPSCGQSAKHRANDARRGDVGDCQHCRYKDKPSTKGDAARAEFVGKELANGWRCVEVEVEGDEPMLILQHDGACVRVRRRADRVRQGVGLAPPGSKYCRGAAALDERFRDSEQWKPCEP